mmetsp:Transcript_108466/g.338059  ORF Transcript_108466/g.338059 Transcript_108466/m.338059 type:complete len:359 (-) Transcript_108466:71-1147(-)|eukprot:CAMPEP_0204598980 /NCGR_PEP_ID=MMETSP0661-20131031/54586_1 /ASSEMBLY_ACC=CAM_ASM_000606 /TAXON_ID=109239 /ORGANISM="Alexandrium margalefi, Strain AMGDE01CS-322" /LENGTH=358 /DNA_ID=CAMNT_0051609689 /DNA_START=33 /DNA_END=1109 /DNA_ORIENTATION=-
MSLGEPAGGHWFSGNPLDRASAQRKDPELLEKVLGDPRTLYLLARRPRGRGRGAGAGRPGPVQFLFDGNRILWHTREQALSEFGVDVAQAPTQLLVLGLLEGAWRCALEVPDPQGGPREGGRRWVSGRQLNNPVHQQEEVAICGQALAGLQWRNTARFSGRTGQPARPVEGGSRHEAGPGDRMYPRVDPAVIMAVVSPDSQRCLLGRYPGTDFFTCLAGFVEQGESVEEACRRETLEEVGVQVDRVLLHSSQPWPIGRAGSCELMIGCMARAASERIVLDKDEMAAAEWFTRKEVAAMVRRATGGVKPTKDAPVVPAANAVAHHLLKCFADGFSWAADHGGGGGAGATSSAISSTSKL